MIIKQQDKLNLQKVEKRSLKRHFLERPEDIMNLFTKKPDKVILDELEAAKSSKDEKAISDAEKRFMITPGIYLQEWIAYLETM